MKKFFSKIAILLSLAMLLSVGGGANVPDRPIRKAVDDNLAHFSVVSNGGATTYARYTLADKIVATNNWVMTKGQTIYFGGKDSTTMVSNSTDLNAVKAVNSAATTSTLGLAGAIAQFPLANVGKITFTYSNLGNGTAPKAYVVKSSSLTNVYEQITLKTGAGLSAQGVTTSAGTTYTFEFDIISSSVYYALVVDASSGTNKWCRLDNAQVKLFEGAPLGPNPVDVASATQNVADTISNVVQPVLDPLNGASDVDSIGNLPVSDDDNGSIITYSSTNAAVTINNTTGKVSIDDSSLTAVTLKAFVENTVNLVTIDDEYSVTFNIKATATVAAEKLAADQATLETFINTHNGKSGVVSLPAFPINLDNGSHVVWTSNNTNFSINASNGTVSITPVSVAGDSEVVITAKISLSYKSIDLEYEYKDAEAMELSILVLEGNLEFDITFVDFPELNQEDYEGNTSFMLPTIDESFIPRGKKFAHWLDQDEIIHLAGSSLLVLQDYTFTPVFENNQVDELQLNSAIKNDFDVNVDNGPRKSDEDATFTGKLLTGSNISKTVAGSLSSSELAQIGLDSSRFSLSYVKNSTNTSAFFFANTTSMRLYPGQKTGGGGDGSAFTVSILGSGYVIESIKITLAVSQPMKITDSTGASLYDDNPGTTTPLEQDINSSAFSIQNVKDATGSATLEISRIDIYYYRNDTTPITTYTVNPSLSFDVDLDVMSYDKTGVFVIPTRLLGEHTSIVDYYLENDVYSATNPASMLVDIIARTVKPSGTSISFSAIIKNIPVSQYGEEFIAVGYYTLGNSIFFSQEITTSLKGEAQYLLDNPAGLTAHQLAALAIIVA